VVKVLTAQIRHLEKEVVAHVKLREEFQLLRTARGIGEAIALTIMCEVGDIRRFPKVGNFASYCRCVKSERLSNGKRKRAGNKRNGNPYLSWAFTDAAHFAVRFEPRAKSFTGAGSSLGCWSNHRGWVGLLRSPSLFESTMRPGLEPQGVGAITGSPVSVISHHVDEAW
jgi:hypothetical protein